MRRRGRRAAVRQPVSYLRTRLFSMVLMLIIVGMLFNRAKDPRTWRWIADDRQANAAAATIQPPAESTPETVVPGPTDLDPDEAAEVAKLFEAVTDKTPLVPVEMPAYWRLLRWAEAQPFQELQKRSLSDIPLVKLWDHPEEFRGQPMTLRLHIRRLLDFPAPQNSAEVKTVYEAWGWTDESKSFPYVVVFSELPPGMKTGTEVDYDAIFAGYFLKLMSYPDSLERRRASPLLMGRLINRYPTGAKPPRQTGWSSQDWLMIGGGAVLVALAIFSAIRSTRRSRTSLVAAHDEIAALDFFSGAHGGDAAPDANGRTEPEPGVFGGAPVSVSGSTIESPRTAESGPMNPSAETASAREAQAQAPDAAQG